MDLGSDSDISTNTSEKCKNSSFLYIEDLSNINILNEMHDNSNQLNSIIYEDDHHNENAIENLLPNILIKNGSNFTILLNSTEQTLLYSEIKKYQYYYAFFQSNLYVIGIYSIAKTIKNFTFRKYLVEVIKSLEKTSNYYKKILTILTIFRKNIIINMSKKKNQNHWNCTIMSILIKEVPKLTSISEEKLMKILGKIKSESFIILESTYGSFIEKIKNDELTNVAFSNISKMQINDEVYLSSLKSLFLNPKEYYFS
jgi:hypothetical protein